MGRKGDLRGHLGDQNHMDELKKAMSDPLHRRLLDTFTKMVRDPEKGTADYATGLKSVLEEQLAAEEPDAAGGSHN